MSEESPPAGTIFVAGRGFSTVLADADFETYSEAGYRWVPELQKWKSLEGYPEQTRGLKAVGVRNYVEHPSFRLLSLAYDLKDGAGRRHWKPGDPPPLDLFAHVEAGGLLEAWNSGFEWQVWTFHCVPVLGWPPLALEQMRCAMAKSRANAWPGALANAGDVIPLANKKHPDGERLIRKLTVPRNPTKTNPALCWTPETAPEDFAALYAYNVGDIVSEAEASMRTPDLSLRELEIWKADQRINTRGMQIDTVAVDNCIAIIEQAEWKYNAELHRITNGAVAESTEVAKILTWCATQGVRLYNLDDETVTEALEKRDTYPANVVRVLEIRAMLGFGSVKKLYAFKHQTTKAGRIHDLYAYHGAHTGLWNGQGVQPANLYKGRFTSLPEIEEALGCIATRCLDMVEYRYGVGTATEIVASCLRSLIIARPGHKLVSSDYTAIQAVVTAALAGEEWRLEVFRTHGKIYEMCASKITGKPFEFYIDHKKRTGSHHEDRQPYGKIAELSSGFQGWIGAWVKFGALKYMSEDQIKRAILAWRAASPAIVELWGGQTRKFGPGWDDVRPELYGLEGAAVAAVLHPGQAFDYRGTLYQTHGDALYCRTVSGGIITYHAPRLAPSTRPYARPWELALSYEGWNSNATKGPPGWLRMSLYGGVLTQNVVSRDSREVQAGAILRLEGAGYPIVMHTHDEDVAEVPIGFGSVEDLEDLMTPPDDWARTPDGKPWPIFPRGGWEGPRYGKFE